MPHKLGVCDRRTATKYRNTTAATRHLAELGAALACSVANMVAVAEFGMKRPFRRGTATSPTPAEIETQRLHHPGVRDGKRPLSREFARQGQWTRYDSIRLPDRASAALVQSACNKPGSRQITHNHVRSGHGAWMAGPCRIPKLTVRVRFPSPAPYANTVAAEPNSRTPALCEPTSSQSRIPELELSARRRVIDPQPESSGTWGAWSRSGRSEQGELDRQEVIARKLWMMCSACSGGISVLGSAGSPWILMLCASA
jgi:hypothetical protein